MSRSVAGKSGVVGDVFAGSDTAARLADYSGTQYYFIAGRGIVAPELSPQSAVALSDVRSLSLPLDNTESHSADSGSEKDTSTSKDQKTDVAGKEPAKVCVVCQLMYSHDRR